MPMPATGIPGNLGSLDLQTDGSYTYTVANSAVQYLNTGDTHVDTFTVTAADGTTKDVNFTIHGIDESDTTPPTVTSLTMSDSALKIGDTPTVTITFSEAMTNFDNSDVAAESGNLSTLTSSVGGVTWTGILAPTSNIEDTSNVV
jgi:VCBS repeat-containing protein